MCLCSTLAEKGPILFPCWPQSAGTDAPFAVCFRDRDCIDKPITLVQRLPLELKNNLKIICTNNLYKWGWLDEQKERECKDREAGIKARQGQNMTARQSQF